MDGWAVYPASKSDRGRSVCSASISAGTCVGRPICWQERQPNRPLSDSLAQNSIESARLVCLPAGHAVRPASKPFRTYVNNIGIVKRQGNDTLCIQGLAIIHQGAYLGWIVE